MLEKGLSLKTVLPAFFKNNWKNFRYFLKAYKEIHPNVTLENVQIGRFFGADRDLGDVDSLDWDPSQEKPFAGDGTCGPRDGTLP